MRSDLNLRRVLIAQLLLCGMVLLEITPNCCAEQIFTENVRLQTAATPQFILEKTGAAPFTWVVEGDEVNYFVRDAINNVIPFKIEEDAPNNSLVVFGHASNCRVGIGTSQPGGNLHIAAAAVQATITLEGLNGLGWDIVGSTTDFHLVDLVNHGLEPFIVENGAPDDTLHLAKTGNVGLGIFNPLTLLHARKPAQANIAETLARFDVSDDTIGKLEISNASSSNGIFHPKFRGTTASQAVALTIEGLVTTDAGTNPVVAFSAAKAAGGAVANRPLVVFRNNDVVKARIAANGDVFATSFSPTSSRCLKERIVELDSRKASAALQQLTPVEYVYKDDPSAEQRVGFIAEDVPEIVANADRKSVPIMDVVALLTRVVKDQQKVNAAQQQQIEEQQKINEALIQRLTVLENREAK